MNDIDRFEKFTERARRVLRLVLPRSLARLMEKLLPSRGRHRAGVPFLSLLDPRALADPAVAHGLATGEVLRMAHIATNMFELSMRAFEERPRLIYKHITALNELDAAIKDYLTQLDEQTITEEQARLDMTLLTIVDDLNAIGNVITTCFMGLTRRRFRGPVQFSQEGRQDLLHYHQQIIDALRQVLAALATRNPVLATKLLERSAELKQVKRNIHLRHIREYRAGIPRSKASSAVYMDLLDAMSSVLEHTFNIAYNIAYALQSQTSIAQSPTLLLYQWINSLPSKRVLPPNASSCVEW